MRGDAGGTPRPDVAVDALGADRRPSGVSRQNALASIACCTTVPVNPTRRKSLRRGVIRIMPGSLNWIEMGDRQSKRAAGPMQDADGDGIAGRCLMFEFRSTTCRRDLRACGYFPDRLGRRRVSSSPRLPQRHGAPPGSIVQ